MIDFASLSDAAKTILATLLLLTLCMGVCITILIGRRQGVLRLSLTVAGALTVGLMLVLYAASIPAERARPFVSPFVVWFCGQPLLFTLPVWLAVVIYDVLVIVEDQKRRRKEITPSAIKESLDHLHLGLCFARSNGLVMLTNHRINELSHAILGEPIQSALRFWEALREGDTVEGVTRMAGGEHPEFRLKDHTVWSFRKETLNHVIQIVAAETTRQHQLVDELRVQQRELEEMNARIRDYGEKVDQYVIARERLETRVNLHGFLGQSLLMTRHYLRYHQGDQKRILDIWQRNIDVLRLEAEPQAETDSFASLKNAAQAIGMQVHVRGSVPVSKTLQKLMASMGAEALTNAVRHAGASQLWIDLEETDTQYLARYTNDGQAPSAPVKEGGGLSTARRKMEAEGGRMTITSAPRFELTLAFGKEVTTDVSCTDCGR